MREDPRTILPTDFSVYPLRLFTQIPVKNIDSTVSKQKSSFVLVFYRIITVVKKPELDNCAECDKKDPTIN